jgi:hypothetical protein
VLPENFYLHVVEGGHLVGAKAVKVEPVRGVGLGNALVGQLDLVKGAVGHAPEHVAPGLVEGLDVAIAGL